MREIKPVTSIDVAKRAGVSQSAVSRTFTPGAAVSEATRHKVLDAAKALSYRPNAIARTLSTNRSRIIGVVLSYLDNQFYPAVVEQLSRALQGHGFHVMLFFAEAHQGAVSAQGKDVDSALTQLMAYQLDGVVLASTTLSSRLARECVEAGIPVVMFNRSASGAQANSVTSNNIDGGHIAGLHLIEQGHRRIAYIAGRDDASTNRDRETGLLQALNDNRLELFRRANGNFEHAAAAEATRAIFSGTALPDAVVVASDYMAFAVMDTLRYELGLRVPEDASVISFDDVPLAAWPAYNLTTVAQSVPAMVSSTVNLLLDQLTDASVVTRDVSVACRLVVRGSTQVSATSLEKPGAQRA